MEQVTETHNDLKTSASENPRKAPRLQVINTVIIIIGTVLSVVGVVALVNLMTTRVATAEARDRYEECAEATNEFTEASDYLTAQARMGVVMGNVSHMNAYLNEYANERHRDHAVEILKKNGEGSRAQRELSDALDRSNDLAQRELYAMKLACEAFDLQEIPSPIAEVELTDEDEGRSEYEKKVLSEGLVLGDEYDKMKSQIRETVNNCSKALTDDLWNERMESLEKEKKLQWILFTALILDVAFLAIAGISNYLLVMRPLRSHDISIQENKPLAVKGSREVRNLALSYNRLYLENMRRTTMLKRQAQTDALTGLYNRGSFDHLIDGRDESVSLIMVDVDLFKEINDSNGHAVGDEVLKKVASSLRRHFRTTDYACRIGGDEFAVVLIDTNGEMESVVARKLDDICADLADTSDGLPKVTLSVGVAFGAKLPEGSNLYHAADTALYEAKHQGRNRYVFYSGKLMT